MPADEHDALNNSIIMLASGGYVDPLDLKSEDVRIEDIAHALSNQCRFTGHTKRFYSVAQHSVLVAAICPPGRKGWGLLHDGSEYVLQDIARPLKQDPHFGRAYRGAEKRAQRVIAERFGLEWPEPPEVKEADRKLLVTEARDLFPKRTVKNCNEPYLQQMIASYKPLTAKIIPWLPPQAYDEFMQLYQLLKEVGECS